MGAPKGQVPIDRKETLRQKDCNLADSWKDPTLSQSRRVRHRRGQILSLSMDNLSG